MTVSHDDELAAVYEREYARLVALLTVVGRDRSVAEETAQEAFIRLIQHWPKVRGYEDPPAWLRTVAIRLLISGQRRGAVARRVLSGLRLNLTNDPSHAADARLDLDAAFARLSPAQRAVVVLHHLYDLPVQEIADVLGVPTGTVKSRLARARARLEPLMAASERTPHD